VKAVVLLAAAVLRGRPRRGIGAAGDTVTCGQTLTTASRSRTKPDELPGTRLGRRRRRITIDLNGHTIDGTVKLVRLRLPRPRRVAQRHSRTTATTA